MIDVTAAARARLGCLLFAVIGVTAGCGDDGAPADGDAGRPPDGAQPTPDGNPPPPPPPPPAGAQLRVIIAEETVRIDPGTGASMISARPVSPLIGRPPPRAFAVHTRSG